MLYKEQPDAPQLLRHQCRNPRCGARLKIPTDDRRNAFCAPGCEAQYFERHCRVCEQPLSRKTTRRQVCGRSRCRHEFQRHPEQYALRRPGAELGHNAPENGSRSRYKLPTLPASDFPAPVSADGKSFELDPEAARRLFVVPQLAISTEETRYYLNGISLRVIGNRLAAVATDGHRLIRSMVELPPDADALTSVIIPRAAVVEIGKLTKSGPIKLTIGAKRIEAATASHRLGSKLIDGTFPDYARVIPAGSNCSAVVDREDLIAALERLQAVAEQAKKVAAVAGLVWGDGELKLCLAHQPDTADDTIAATTSGAGRVAASARYLIDLLGALDGETVKIQCANGSSPIIITGDDDTLLLCMPCTWGAS